MCNMKEEFETRQKEKLQSIKLSYFYRSKTIDYEQLRVVLSIMFSSREESKTDCGGQCVKSWELAIFQVKKHEASYCLKAT